MKHRFHSSQWVWQDLDLENEKQAEEFVRKHHTCKRWIEAIKGNDTNSIGMYTGTPGGEAMWGSLVYVQNANHKNNKEIFHFYLTKKEMITADLNLSRLDYVNEETMKEKMQHAETSIEGFLILIGEILTHFLLEIDKFEIKLRDLLWEMKEKNNVKTLNRTAETDHQLLVWKNLVIPMNEIRMVVEEVFGDEAMEGVRFKQTKRRINRARSLIRDYEEEIEALISLEDVVSNHRGNEIMKTLTVITTLFTPVTALGAIWGMNFTHMPELEWKFGYLFAGSLIVLSTLALYVFLKKRGWMGDLLKVRGKKSFFD
ncbi:magnesium transporter CorA family protein [Domibacillus robiginosus]|uniref:magnesium transporter CorA family protein n=1 Tax=Domibacillus robiginosus TaxID=1071054 RepID=UPI00067BF4FE|nr:magnesium transporter CorA family protein [Domibacillus robiginosus]